MSPGTLVSLHFFGISVCLVNLCDEDWRLSQWCLQLTVVVGTHHIDTGWILSDLVCIGSLSIGCSLSAAAL